MRTYRACWYIGAGKTPGLAIPRSRSEFLRLERRLWGVLDPAWVIAAAVRAATVRPTSRKVHAPRPTRDKVYSKPTKCRVAHLADRLRAAAEELGYQPGDTVSIKRVAVKAGVDSASAVACVCLARKKQGAVTGWRWPYRSHPRGSTAAKKAAKEGI